MSNLRQTRGQVVLKESHDIPDVRLEPKMGSFVPIHHLSAPLMSSKEKRRVFYTVSERCGRQEESSRAAAQRHFTLRFEFILYFYFSMDGRHAHKT